MLLFMPLLNLTWSGDAMLNWLTSCQPFLFSERYCGHFIREPLWALDKEPLWALYKEPL
jgi:hypothetical protein